MAKQTNQNRKRMPPQSTPWTNTNCRDGNLRLLIAWRIRQLRKSKFPGRGGGGRCAAAYNVSGQQWSSWETGFRTPDDERLANMAKFFGVKPAILKTEPEDWPELRKKLEADRQRRRRRADGAESTESGESQMPPAKESAADALPSKSGGEAETWFTVFDLLVEARKKHAKGEIPDERYKAGMEAVKAIVKITFGENA